MSKKSKTPFTDNFFSVNRRITYFILGNDQHDIFKYFRNLDLSGGDSYGLFNATGIDTTSNWFIGIFDEPVVVCGQLYPKQTVAVFQGREPGSRFALFSVEEMDAQSQVDDTENESSFFTKGRAMIKKPKCKLIGKNGNIFNLMAIASATLKKHGMAEQAGKMKQRIRQEAKSYDAALIILQEYVDVY